MNKENASKLWKMIQEAGDYLLCQRNTLVTLVHNSYTDNLKFIKNKSHKDSTKLPLKLETKEINQFYNHFICKPFFLQDSLA